MSQAVNAAIQSAKGLGLPNASALLSYIQTILTPDFYAAFLNSFATFQDVLDFLSEKLTGLFHGGTAFAGRPYLVGEGGPELFIPGATGAVISNADLMARGGASAGGTTTVNVIMDGRRIAQAVFSKMPGVVNMRLGSNTR